MLPCFKNVQATLPFKNYFNEDYHHNLYSGLKIKIQQLHSLIDSSCWLVFSASHPQHCWTGIFLRSTYKNLNRENKWL